jgi:hypothetical protein
MLIYKDIFTGDELCSDTFPVKEVDGVILEFTGKHVQRKEGDVKLDGANASAEEEAEGFEENVETGLDIVLNHKLQEMAVYTDLKQFKGYIKDYMKKLAERLAADGKEKAEIDDWKKKMAAWVTDIVKKERFKELQFFSGEGENAADGQIAILEYRTENDEEKPIMMFIKAGLEEEKC